MLATGVFVVQSTPLNASVRSNAMTFLSRPRVFNFAHNRSHPDNIWNGFRRIGVAQSGVYSIADAESALRKKSMLLTDCVYIL